MSLPPPSQVRHEDGVAAGGGLRDAVDGLLPGGRIPLVDGVGVVRVVVGAVHVLQRRDVIHHQRLREAPGRVGEAAAWSTLRYRSGSSSRCIRANPR